MSRKHRASGECAYTALAPAAENATVDRALAGFHRVQHRQLHPALLGMAGVVAVARCVPGLADGVEEKRPRRQQVALGPRNRDLQVAIGSDRIYPARPPLGRRDLGELVERADGRCPAERPPS